MANSLNKIEKKNEQLMANYWQKNTSQQKQYMTSLMGDFTNYVEQRRSEDMQYLIAKINLLETDTDLLELETNQLKSSYAVNNTEDAY
jgi:transcription initiation factor IIF auxiliary subunit